MRNLNTVLIAKSKAASIQVNMLIQKCCQHYIWQDTEIRCDKLDMETSDVPVTNLRKFFQPSKDRFLKKVCSIW